MMNEKNEQGQFPKTLQQAIVYFAVPENAHSFMTLLRWPNGVITCPRCGSDKNTYISTRRTWQCKGCKKMFTVKLGTIMEDSPIGLDKWLSAMWLIVNAKNGVSSYEISRALGLTQKSSWFLLHRIRLAMRTGTFNKLSGEIEADETYVGGKARNMHKKALKKRVAQFATPRTGRNQNIGKVAVMGLLERHGEVRVMVVPGTKRQMLQDEIRKNVEPGSHIYTDALRSYNGLDDDYIHSVINHAEKYVEGRVHTNGIENFWSLLKRCLRGTYVSVMPFHLFRYLDEEAFRYNNRKMTDQLRFLMVAPSIIGRRITYKKLIGQTLLAE